MGTVRSQIFKYLKTIVSGFQSGFHFEEKLLEITRDFKRSYNLFTFHVNLLRKVAF
jgi:hypothetical protein